MLKTMCFENFIKKYIYSPVDCQNRQCPLPLLLLAMLYMALPKSAMVRTWKNNKLLCVSVFSNWFFHGHFRNNLRCRKWKRMKIHFFTLPILAKWKIILRCRYQQPMARCNIFNALALLISETSNAMVSNLNFIRNLFEKYPFFLTLLVSGCHCFY